MERWIGKVAVVTGCSAGIGAAIGRTLADHGIIVVGLARKEEKIKELSKKTSGKIHAIKCDVTSEEDIIKSFKQIEKSFGGVDILINNAGQLKLSSLVDGPTKDWKDMFDLNVLGLSICTREALRIMRKNNNDGHVLNINSTMGHRVPQYPGVNFGPYSATKFAVTALTDALRTELQGEGRIKVTSISPGIVFTDMSIDIMKQMNIQLPESTPPGFLDVQDVTDAVVYAITTRPTVQVHEIIIQATGNPASATQS